MRFRCIGSGPEVAEFRAFFAEERIEQHSLIDPDRTLLTALGLRVEPAVLFVDRSGNVLLVDTRPVGRASQFPIGRVLPDLAASLQPLEP